MSFLNYKKTDSIVEIIENSRATNPTVSVVIVAYNTNKDLLYCLESIIDQITQKVEILVIDNGKNEAIYNKLIKLSINYIKLEKNMGVCFGRNIGILKSKGDILAFLDDDCIVDRNFISSIFSIFQDKNIYGLRGRIKFKTNTVYNFLQNHYDLGNNVFPYFINVEGVCVVRKKEIVEVGGWDENIWGHEGLELSYRLVKKFGPDGLIYHPDVIIYHDFANSLYKLIKKDIRHQEIYKYLYKTKPYLFDFVSYYKKESKIKKYNLSMINRIKLSMLKKIRDEVLIRPTLQRLILKN